MKAAPVMEHYTRSVGITPDQSGCIVTDRVHALIDDKLDRGCASYAEWTPRLSRIPHTDAPAKAAFLTPKHRPRGTSITAQQPFRQSADPLSKNSRKSKNFGEWVCGLANEPTGHNYAHALRPTHPTSSNQNDHTQACSYVVLHHLAGYYTSSELVQYSLTGAGLPGTARLESCRSSYGAGRAAHGLVARQHCTT